jgi:hypothetical protein
MQQVRLTQLSQSSVPTLPPRWEQEVGCTSALYADCSDIAFSIFQPLINSQSMKTNSPKKVIMRKPLANADPDAALNGRYLFTYNNGADRDRTGDLLLAKHMGQRPISAPYAYFCGIVHTWYGLFSVFPHLVRTEPGEETWRGHAGGPFPGPYL